MSAHGDRAAIAPPAGELARPRWSVMIPTFNCAERLRVTLAGVLVQDPGPEQMQIEVVDDCSTDDDPADILRAIDFIHGHLPPERVDALRSREHEVAATMALRRARQAIDTGRPQVAPAQVRAAIRASRSPAVVLGIAHTALRLAIRARCSRARA